jgi:5-(carboxyamino)imidazole ribonucleotide mutase
MLATTDAALAEKLEAFRKTQTQVALDMKLPV